MIDFHTHILPKVDDGSKNEKMTMNMLEKLSLQDVDTVCATSHYIPDEYEITREKYDLTFNGIKSLNSKINIVSGLELYISPDLIKQYENKKIWGINDTNYLLIELPMDFFPIYAEDLFYNLKALGLNPIIAHPERNSKIIDDVDLLINLVNQGTLVQMNSGSLIGEYGSLVKKFAEKLVSMNLVHVLGSDAHNDSSRPPRLKEGFDILHKINPDLYQWILENEKLIISGDEINNIPEIYIKKQTFFGKLFNGKK